VTIQIHPTAMVSAFADIEESVRGSNIEIGAGAVVDSFVKIKPAGGRGNIVIGPESVVNAGCVLYTGNGISIGSSVLIAANCTFAPTNHEFSEKDKTIRSQGFAPSKGGILIEDDVWIGANCVLLDGAIVRTGSIVGAGSVIRGELPAYGVYGGNPIKLIRMR